MDEDGDIIPEDMANPTAFNPGAEIIMRDLASPSAREASLTAQLFAADESYDVKDLEVSSDGRTLIFALRAPELEDVDEDEQPTWNIWQYSLDDSEIKRVISSDLIAEQGDDFAPAFLPDGSIVFSSTRQRTNKSTLLDEGKPQFSGLEENRRTEAAVLHLMDEEGNNIRQITFNQSHDLDPYVMSDGKIVFSRWDNMGNNSGFNLYRVNPDGSQMEILYGNHSHNTGTNQNFIEYSRPQEMPDGQLLTMTRARQSFTFSGDLTKIDIANFTENTQLVFNGAPGNLEAQQSLTADDVSNDESEISLGGYYNSAFPLWDGTDRLLVSWSLCRLSELDQNMVETVVACTEENLANPDVVAAPPLFGVWMMDLQNQTILPIVNTQTGEDIDGNPQEGYMYTEVVAMQPRTLPTYIPDASDLDQDLIDENVGSLHIRSVYDFDGIDLSLSGIEVTSDPFLTTAAERPARFLRIVKAVSIPDDDLVMLNGSAFGRSSGQLMREIIGYVPIEPDGTVKFKVPANIAFAVSVVDNMGRRITGRHQNWLQVTPGEQLQCNGCHTSDSELPHGRKDAVIASINLGAPVTGLPFPNTSTDLFADADESMAETYSRINGIRTPTVDIQFIDEWTDEAVRPKDASFDYSYSDLESAIPVAIPCIDNWNANCRITINYPDVIQPIWDVDRRVFDTDGFTLLADHSCSSCHSPQDEVGLARIPAAQLDLSATTSTDNPDHLTSYRELLFNDAEQEINNTILVDRLIPLLDNNGDPVYEVDDEGELILDALGNPIPVMVNVAVSPALRVTGALASPRLFDLLQPAGTHFGWLSGAEIKLIAEWLDIGAQYYNNPFDVPQN
ncbi:MAG: hypothetical protein DRQ47_01215 [Gammaproteobacteria bacterium]|nr:MAG: hypothetical protein DRQ47_01215 [Gammaproteobacteria bacterium]